MNQIAHLFKNYANINSTIFAKIAGVSLGSVLRKEFLKLRDFLKSDVNSSNPSTQDLFFSESDEKKERKYKPEYCSVHGVWLTKEKYLSERIDILETIIEDNDFKYVDISKYRHLATCDSDLVDLHIALYEFYQYKRDNRGIVLPSSLNDKNVTRLMKTPYRKMRKSYLDRVGKREEEAKTALGLESRINSQFVENEKTEFDGNKKTEFVLNKKTDSDKNKKTFYDITNPFFNENNEVIYGINRNNLHRLNWQKTTFTGCLRHNLRNSVLFGQAVVLDFSYDDYMACFQTGVHLNHVIKLLKQNLRRPEAFRIHLCNLRPESNTSKVLRRHLEAVADSPRFYFHCHQESFMSLFPREKLVYLSPDSENLLEKVDFDDVYIVGGFVDCKHCKRPLSLEIAKREGIRSARFPIDDFLPTLDSGDVKNTLSMDWTLGVLYDARETGDWEFAVKNSVPEDFRT